jgi:hypothetical protein
MLNTFKKETIIFLLMVLFLSGCATVPGKGITATKKSDLYEDTETLVMLDRKIRKFLYVVDQSETLTEDGRLVVNARFMNKTKGTLEVQIQTLFKDANGNITDETNWELILVPSKSHYYYEAKSLNDRARKYTIKCRSVE